MIVKMMTMNNNFRLSNILLPYQKKFIQNDKKNKIWLSSRQIGKSFTLSYIATQKALEKTNSLVLCISTGARAASELIKKCVQMADAIKVMSDGKVTYTNNADCITFNTGGRILSLPSGNPQALRGYTASAVLIDECAFIENPSKVFAAISPTLTRNKEANLIIASTPAGKNNFFYKLFNEADDDWYVQVTTIEDAVKDGLKIDIDKLRETIKDSEIFDQEYMCKFSNEYSSLIDTSLLDFYEDEITSNEIYLGMDVGSTTDRTAIVTVKTLADKIYIDDIITLHKADYETQLNILRDLHNKYHYTAGKIDSNGIGSALSEFATKTVTTRITGYTWTSTNKTPAYENLRAKIFDHKILFNKKYQDLIISDFNNVHRIVSESGKVTYEAGRNKNGHSDVTSAIVLALESISKTKVNKQVPMSILHSSVFGNRRSRL